ncbi:UNVERIFIED_CONTAM: Pclaf [Trichonephila clavipes]
MLTAVPFSLGLNCGKGMDVCKCIVSSRHEAGGKAPRKIQVISNSVTKVTSGKASQRRSGGNPYCPRPTPEWQMPITEFFDRKHSEENAGGSNQIEDITESNVLDEAASGCSNTL